VRAFIKGVDGLTLAAKSDSGHWLVMDTDAEAGGTGGASKPLELVLMGLGGCTGMDVLSILRKMRVEVDRFEMVLDADRSEEHPKIFTRISVEYRLYGKAIDKDKVEKAIDLSRTKYCSVSAMLSKAVQIEFAYQINPNPEYGTGFAKLSYA
jgi:putative redox protein